MSLLKKIWWVILIALFGIAYFVYITFIKKKESKNFPDNNDRFLSKLTNDEAMSIAESLYTAMDEFGTDEETIYKLLSDKNKYDYSKIHYYFGLRRYFIWGRAGFLGTYYNLTNWLQMEIDRDLYNELANNIKSPLLPVI